MRKQALVAMVLGVLAACHTGRGVAGERLLPWVSEYPALADKILVYGHVRSDSMVVRGASVTPERPIGTVQELPPKYSETHHETVLAAQRLYEMARYTEAADVLEPALADEPGNAFLYNEYGRALFWVEELRPRAYWAYQGLIAGLDKYWREQLAAPVSQAALVAVRPPSAGPDAEVVAIDLWFLEAYWKIASLYLDRGEFAGAAFEISRFLAGVGPAGPPELLEQAYGYLAEAYHGMGNVELADHFARKTLLLNPENDYVAPFLKKSGP